jgi:hypothetical protein
MKRSCSGQLRLGSEPGSRNRNCWSTTRVSCHNASLFYVGCGTSRNTPDANTKNEAAAADICPGSAGRSHRARHLSQFRKRLLRSAKARGHRDVVTVVGHAAAIAAGEWITASGEWVNDRTHGQQFKARFLRTSPPTSADGIEKYLSSGMIRGVGPVYAKKLVRASAKGVRCHRSDAGPSARGGWHWASSRGQYSRSMGRTEGGAGNHGVPA